jgi:hypothetical protein
MFKKDRLTKVLENRISDGEEGIPLLNRHLTTALFCSKLSADASKTVREKIHLSAASPERRAHLLQELKENLQGIR